MGLPEQSVSHGTVEKSLIGKLKDIKHRPVQRIPTYLLDDYLNGGLAKHSVNLVHGPKGSYKTTLWLQILSEMSMNGLRVLLIEAEEEIEDLISRQSEIIPHNLSEILYVRSNKYEVIWQQILRHGHIDLIVGDSINAITSIRPDKNKLNRTMNILEMFYRDSHKYGYTTALIAHENKQGKLAGFEDMAHLVEAVFRVTSVIDLKQNQKMVKIESEKNRYSPFIFQKLIWTKDNGLQPFDEDVEEIMPKRRKHADHS